MSAPAAITLAPLPNKGLATLTTAPTPAGTLLLRSPKHLIIALPHHALLPHHIASALATIPAATLTDYRALHAGPTGPAHRTLDARIFHANAFGDDSTSWISTTISRINHSCVPNAEIAETENDGDVKVFATKTIAKGGEVTISYSGAAGEGGRLARARVLEDTYGFKCDCVACRLEGREGELSDARRMLIGRAAQMQVGGRLDGGGVIGRSGFLDERERMVVNFLLAGLLEAEGLRGFPEAQALVEAGVAVLAQVMKVGQGVVVLAAVKKVEELMERALGVMRMVRKKGARELVEMGVMWAQLQRRQLLVVPKQFAANPEQFGLERRNAERVFAVQVGGRRRCLTQEEAKQIARSQQEGSSSRG